MSLAVLSTSRPINVLPISRDWWRDAVGTRDERVKGDKKVRDAIRAFLIDNGEEVEETLFRRVHIFPREVTTAEVLVKAFYLRGFYSLTLVGSPSFDVIAEVLSRHPELLRNESNIARAKRESQGTINDDWVDVHRGYTAEGLMWLAVLAERFLINDKWGVSPSLALQIRWVRGRDFETHSPYVMAGVPLGMVDQMVENSIDPLMASEMFAD